MKVVLDTNIVLDVYVFQDPSTQALVTALQNQAVRWIASLPMREELQRVLTYEQIDRRLTQRQISAAQVLQRFDAQAWLMDLAPKASVTCKDPDDQKFIDLAVQHRARLLSHDHAVLCMAKRLVVLGVHTMSAIDFAA